MDNDGNLSPMSLGSDNIKTGQSTEGISIQEQVMDQRDEFSKWMNAVEEALEVESNPGQVEIHGGKPSECGCGSWDCPICFPDEIGNLEYNNDSTGCSACQGMGCPACDGSDFEMEDGSSGGIGTGGMAQMAVGENDDAVAAFKASGGQVTNLPYKGGRQEKNAAEKSMASSHIGGLRGNQNDKPGKGRLSPGNKPIVGEEDENFIETPKSGKGVKLGDIIHKTEFRKVGGQNSPLTYGEDNLDEEGWYDPSSSDIDNGNDSEEYNQMIDNISYMQDLGLSKDNHHYDMNTLSGIGMSLDKLREIRDRVMGDVSEATGTTKTKTKHHLDDLDDVLNPRQADLPATMDTDDGEITGDDDEPMNLPTASRADTQRRVGAMTPSDTMRDLMNRINPDAGGDEPEFVEPQQPQNELVIRTARDVPAVIGSAMLAAGVQSPEWHTIDNLPGYGQRNVRGMGRGIFSMFTSTPLEQIKTIANVEGQGPNTDAELRAVAGFLRDNAEDLGVVDVSHGMAIPGYTPEVKEYRANGIRFQIVRDPMGQYIYAYPDRDARLNGPQQDQQQIGNRMPRLRESATLFEQMKWDEEIDEAFIEESTLSKAIGKQRGGQQLVRWLHRKHKLSNEADLEPVKFTKELLWSQFKSNPDDFVIVSGRRGVAGIKPDKKSFDDYIEAKRKKNQEPNPGRNSSLQYQIIAFTDDGQQVDPELLRVQPEDGEAETERNPDPTVHRGRMGKNIGSDIQNPNNTFRLLDDQIGPITTVWISGWSGYRGGANDEAPHSRGAVERDKIAKRAELMKTSNMSSTEAVEKIFMRIKPVLKTLANQSILQINKRAQRYIEGGNFEGAQRVAATGQKLKQLLVSLDTNNPISVFSQRELTSTITRAIAQASGFLVNSKEYNKYALSAASGNVAELRPILDAVRDQLVGL